ncbi:tetratricopeptide repeat family protein [Microcystis aeruginosa TAIHU98]|uniref:Tetratricopeptide repeat family protein n=2 Tax=Microcystis aeruginosa TaxID=1126 RepID=L7EDA0_MICAE|nr:tetratricopeptide repeat family protein [Microcystis aeruginosa TAIHU98]
MKSKTANPWRDLHPTPCPREKLFQQTLSRIQITPTEELAMKSFALLTTVSLISLSTLATVRPVMALESRQPAETRIAQGNNQDAIGHYNRGIDYIQQEKYDLALAEFTKAININPRYAEAYLNRGVLYAVQGKPDLALSDYNQALNINPRDAEAYVRRGILYYYRQETEKAIGDFRQAAELYRQQGNAALYEAVMEILRELGAV